MANGMGPWSICHQLLAIKPLAICERWRRLRHRPDDFRESAALEELASFAAATGHFVFAGADRLLGAARRFDGQQIAVAARRNGAEHLVLFSELDQQHALARAGEEIHLVGLAEDAAAFG